MNKQEALERIASIADAHDLTLSEIESALARSGQVERSAQENLLGRIFGILGSIFVFAGLGVFIALNWDTMNTGARITITLGSGIVAFILAIIASSDARYERAWRPLYLIAAALQPTGILVAINEFSTGGDWHHAVLLTSGIMIFQQGAVFWQKREIFLLFTTWVFTLWFLAVALDLATIDEDFIALFLGALTVGLSMGLEETKYRAMNPFWYFVGSLFFYAGLFGLVEATLIELMFLMTACGGVFLSTYVRSRTLLVTSTVAVLAYISYFTIENFADSQGWPLVLIFLGLVLLGLGNLAMRINNRYIAGV